MAGSTIYNIGEGGVVVFGLLVIILGFILVVEKLNIIWNNISHYDLKIPEELTYPNHEMIIWVDQEGVFREFGDNWVNPVYKNIRKWE